MKPLQLVHKPLSCVAYRQSDAGCFINNTSVVLEQVLDNTSLLTLKVYCTIEGPLPHGNSLNQTPIRAFVSSRDVNRLWFDKSSLENSIQSSLLPALIPPAAGWAGSCFDIKFVIELSESNEHEESDDSDGMMQELRMFQVISSCVNAGSVALSARGVPMRDVVVGSVCSLLLTNGKFEIAVDPDPSRASEFVILVTATAMPSLGQFTAFSWSSSSKNCAGEDVSLKCAENQSKLMKCLLASSVALRPVLTKSLEENVLNSA